MDTGRPATPPPPARVPELSTPAAFRDLTMTIGELVATVERMAQQYDQATRLLAAALDREGQSRAELAAAVRARALASDQFSMQAIELLRELITRVDALPHTVATAVLAGLSTSSAPTLSPIGGEYDG